MDSLPPLPTVSLDRYPAVELPALVREGVGRRPMLLERGDLAARCSSIMAWSLAFRDHFVQRTSLGDTSRGLAQLADTYLKECDLITPYFVDCNMKELYRAYADVVRQSLLLHGHALDWKPPAAQPAGRRIRFGVLAAHFLPSAETFVTLPAFEHIERGSCEVILYALVDEQEAEYQRLCMQCCDRHVHLSGSLAENVKKVRDDNLDVLLIGSNVTSQLNAVTLMAHHRLARATVVASCCPVSPGISTVDYYFSGTFTENPLTCATEYCERLLLADGPAHAFHYDLRPPAALPRSLRRRLNIREDAVVFVSGSNFFKVIPELRHTWARILAEVGDSVLLLYPFNPNWSTGYPAEAFLDSFHKTMNSYGVKKDRLHLIKPMTRHDDVWNVLGAADVYLDSRPYSGATSLIDPLLAGLPVVTHRGATGRCRQAYALLKCIGMEKLSTETEADYISLAVKCAADREYRARVACTIRESVGSTPKFFDTRWYSREMLRVLERIAGSRGNGDGGTLVF